MVEINLKELPCSWATLKPDGTYFWNTGIYEGETPTHFLFRLNGQLTAVLRTAVMKIEFKTTKPQDAIDELRGSQTKDKERVF